MKFLLEFVPCCGKPAPISEDPEEAERSAETLIQRKRGRSGSITTGQGNSAVNPWKPSLCAISEDKIAMEKSEKALLAAKVERTVRRRKSEERSRSKVKPPRSRSYSDDYGGYGRNSVQAIIPAFSPAPFIF